MGPETVDVLEALVEAEMPPWPCGRSRDLIAGGPAPGRALVWVETGGAGSDWGNWAVDEYVFAQGTLLW